MNEDLRLILDMLPFLVPIIILEIALMVTALISVIKRERVTGDNKVIWILIIVLFQLIGPIVYFIAGRKESYVDGNQD